MNNILFFVACHLTSIVAILFIAIASYNLITWAIKDKFAKTCETYYGASFFFMFASILAIVLDCCFGFSIMRAGAFVIAVVCTTLVLFALISFSANLEK